MHTSSNNSLWFGCFKRMELQGRRLPLTVHCLHCLCTSPLLPLLWVSGHAPESFWEWSVGHLWGPPIHQGWRHLAKDDLNEAAGELWQHRCMLFEQFHTLQLDLWTDSRYFSHSHYSLSDHSASFVFKRDEKSECYLDDMLVQFPAVPFLPFSLWHFVALCDKPHDLQVIAGLVWHVRVHPVPESDHPREVGRRKGVLLGH
jgi:hypothetical protein